MRSKAAVFLSLLLIFVFAVGLSACGEDIKAENQKLKTENTNLRSDLDKSKIEIQKLREDLQKSAEKDATISALTAENVALKQQVEDLKGQLAKKKR
jgi:cell division protein FtsB